MRAHLRRLGRRPCDEGAAAVEFALVSIILFPLLFGILEYGYGFFELQAAQATVHMAAESASAGVSSCTATGPTTLPTMVQNAASGNNFRPAGETVSLEFTVTSISRGTYPVTGDPVTLELSYTPRLRLPLVPFPDRIDVQAAAGAQANGTDSVMICPRGRVGL